MEDFLTPKELAERWNVQEQTLANQRWLKTGPKFTKRGWMIIYPLTEILQYEKQKKILPRTHGH